MNSVDQISPQSVPTHDPVESNGDADDVRGLRESWLDRLHRALGPLAGGMILDFVDLTTFGPLGAGGLFVGAAVAWWISSVYQFSTRSRIWFAVLAGLYCLIPFTEVFPLATAISAVSRFRERPHDSAEAG